MTRGATVIAALGVALGVAGCVPPARSTQEVADRVSQVVTGGSPSQSSMVGSSSTEVPVALVVRIETVVSDASAGVVRVSGTASPGARVTVNGTPVQSATDGRWSVELPVERPVTTVRAEATDGVSRATATVSVAVG